MGGALKLPCLRERVSLIIGLGFVVGVGLGLRARAENFCGGEMWLVWRGWWGVGGGRCGGENNSGI